jgi:hypothetical protein
LPHCRCPCFIPCVLFEKVSEWKMEVRINK